MLRCAPIQRGLLHSRAPILEKPQRRLRLLHNSEEEFSKVMNCGGLAGSFSEANGLSKIWWNFMETAEAIPPVPSKLMLQNMGLSEPPKKQLPEILI